MVGWDWAWQRRAGRGRRRVDIVGRGRKGLGGVSLSRKGAEKEYRKGRNRRRPDW